MLASMLKDRLIPIRTLREAF